ncbi:MAG: UDP-3-O-(3-hydroxymyristoyl)glucosamine N-acyltransferase, partial [Pseudomonadota bacterium]|nr:UDP-3-O-(3-hydroxymyristoyl)glucosamine N-acyltransferase [Pseudomonadota bacterium]
MTLRLGDIVASLAGEFDARLVGDPDVLIQRLAPLDTAGPTELSFLSHIKYQGQLSQSLAACVVVGPQAEQAAILRGACIVVGDPYLYFARITHLWKKFHQIADMGGIHPTAFIDPLARLAKGVSVGAFACIGPHAVLEVGVRVGEHGVIGREVIVGTQTRLAARVTVADGCVIGKRCIVHPGAVIGADGFGFAPHEGTWVKIEQLGAVRIGNDVEIGANT